MLSRNGINRAIAKQRHALARQRLVMRPEVPSKPAHYAEAALPGTLNACGAGCAEALDYRQPARVDQVAASPRSSMLPLASR